MVDRIAEIWGGRTPYAVGERWPVRVDLKLADGIAEADVDRWVQSACVLCSNGCATDIAVKDGRMVGVRGRAGDIVHHGRLGPKGPFGSWQGMQSDERLTRPLIGENGALVPTDWDSAMERIVARSRQLLDEDGPLSHGFHTSGQLFLEEYYALGIIGKAGLGTPHMDGRGGDEGELRLRRPARHLPGADERARAGAVCQRLGRRGLRRPHADDVCRAARIFGETPRILSTVLQGFYQASNATAAACQVNNLHLLTGKIGRPGAGILQMRGQPTAQNTRESGADGDLPGFRKSAQRDTIQVRGAPREAASRSASSL